MTGETYCKESLLCEQILFELRKIIRLLDLHSRQLSRNYALTGPQLVLLRQIVRQEGITMSALASDSSLSNATVTGIVDRLEQRGLVTRRRGAKDRRQVLLMPTEAGRALCVQGGPPLLQEQFTRALSGLETWEQAQMVAVLSRLAAMMGPDGARSEGEARTTEAESFLDSCRMLLEDESDPASAGDAAREARTLEVVVHEIQRIQDLPSWTDVEGLTAFLHEALKPYEDTPEDIRRGIETALSEDSPLRGAVFVAECGGRIVGALVLLRTGMRGFVPANLLLFVAVAPEWRGRGIGALLVRRAQASCEGGIKLHVEYQNPARRLYEKLGFNSKYAEMRWNNEPVNDKP